MNGEIGNIWIKLGLGSAEYGKGLKQISSDTKSTTSLLSSAFKGAIDSAQTSLRSLRSVKLKDIINTQEFSSAIGQLKRVQAEYQLTAARTATTASASEKLNAQIAHLNQTLGLHRMAMGTVNTAYQQSLTEKGADAAQTKRLYMELVKLQTTEANLVNSVRQAEAALKQQESQMTKQSTSSKKLGADVSNLNSLFIKFATLAATGAGLFAFADSAVKAGDNVYKLAAKLGLTNQEAAALNRILKISDVEAQSFVSTMIRVDKAVQSAGEKGNMTTRTLDALGISLTDSTGRLLPLNQQLEKLAEGYAKAAKSGEEEAYVTAVLGARGAELIPLLRDYTVNMEAASRVKGIGIDPEQAHQAAIELKVLKMEASQLSMAFANALMPAAQEALPALISGLGEAVGLLKNNKAELLTLGIGVGVFTLLTKGAGTYTKALAALNATQFVTTASTKGLTAALTASPFGLAAVAVAALAGGIYYLSQQENGLIKTTNEYLKTANQESQVHEENAKLIENQIATMQKISGQYIELKNKVDSGVLADNEAAKAKASLANMSSQLIPIIGQEGVARIDTANNTNEAFTSEIKGMEVVLEAEKKMINELIAAEDTRTREQMKQIELRINNLRAGAEAQMTFGERIKSWWVTAGSYELEPEQGAAARQYVEERARERELGSLEAKYLELSGKLHFAPSAGLDTGGLLTDLEAAGTEASKATSEIAKEIELASEKITAAEKQGSLLGLAMQILQEQMKQAADQAAMSGDKLVELTTKEMFLTQELSKQREIVANLDRQYQESIVVKDQAAQKEADLKARYDASAAAADVNIEELNKLGEQLEKASEETVNTAQTTDGLRLKLEQARAAQSGFTKEIFDTRKAMKDYREDLVDIQTELDKVEKKYDEDMAGTLEDYQQKSKDVNDQLKADIKSVNAAYEDALQDRARTLANFVSLFDAIESRDVSGEALLANLQGQVSTFENWSKNIADLAARGIDDGLLNTLRGMGPEAAPEIAALVTLTDEKLTEYADLWREKQKIANEEATAQLEDQKRATSQKISELRAEAAKKLEEYKNDWKKTTDTIEKNTMEAVEAIKTKFIETTNSATTWGVSIGSNVASGIRGTIGNIRSAVDSVLEELARLNVAGVGVSASVTATGMKLPGMASGGYVASPGWAMVGERGPEPVYMPRGATVLPANFAMAGGGTVHIDKIISYGVADLEAQMMRIFRKAGLRPR